MDSSGSASTDSDWRIWTKVVDNGGTAVKLVKNGPGYLRLANSNTYTGGTIVNGGALVGDGGSAFGTGAVQVNSGAVTVNLNAGTMGNNFTLATGASVTIDNATNNGTLNGNFSGGGTVTIQNTSAANLSDNVNGSWTGFTGTLNYNTSNRVVNIFAPASMDLSNAAVNFANTGNLSNSSFRTSSTGTTKFGSLSGFGYLDINGATEIGNLGTNTTFSGVIRAAGSVTKVGSGTLTLTGANTYSGSTNINGGKVNLGIAQNSTTSGPLGTSGTISFGGGTLQHSAANTTDYSPRFSTAAAQAFSVDTNGQNVTCGTGLISSGGTLAKSGSGKLTLIAANTYSGNTVVDGGTISLTSTGDLNNGSLVRLAASGATTSISAGPTNAVTYTVDVAAGGSYASRDVRSSLQGGLTNEITKTFDDAKIIDGNNATGLAETISMTWRGRATNETPGSSTNVPMGSYAPAAGLASDVITITGMSKSGGQTRTNTAGPETIGSVTLSTETDLYVLQMTYDPAAITTITGLSESAAATAQLIQIGWLNPNGTNSTADDTWVTAISGNFGTNSGTFFTNSSYSTAGSPLTLGTWGVDQGNDVVWAVLNHNSTFSVIPEPGTFSLLALGAVGAMSGRARRRRR